MSERAYRKRWIDLWLACGARIIKLPEYMQEILLDDINAAIENRLKVMEMIAQREKAFQKDKRYITKKEELDKKRMSEAGE